MKEHQNVLLRWCCRQASQRCLAASPNSSSTFFLPSQATKWSKVIRCLQRYPRPAWKPWFKSHLTATAQPCLAQCCNKGQSGGHWTRRGINTSFPEESWFSSTATVSSSSNAVSNCSRRDSYFCLALSCSLVGRKPATKASCLKNNQTDREKLAPFAGNPKVFRAVETHPHPTLFSQITKNQKMDHF